MKITIRDLFWLVLVVALALGWGFSAAKHRATNYRLRVANYQLLQDVYITQAKCEKLANLLGVSVTDTTTHRAAQQYFGTYELAE